MSHFQNILQLYIPLIGWSSLGFFLGRILPAYVPFFLGKALFWVGVPVGIVAFLRQAELSDAIWLAPVICWLAIALSAAIAWLWIQAQLYGNSTPSRSTKALASQPTQGSFILTAMLGNTGYLGYPVILALVGTEYFGWALLYDTIGGLLGAYGFGVALAARFGANFSPLPSHSPADSPTHCLDHSPHSEPLRTSLATTLRAIAINPALWSVAIGLGSHNMPLPESIELLLKRWGWSVITVALVLIGMRLSQLKAWRNLRQVSVSLTIKMLLVPLALGLLLSACGLSGSPRLILVLQMAMPPAFATLVIAEAYNLDRDLTVTALVIGSIAFLFLLPFWLWLFGH